MFAKPGAWSHTTNEIPYSWSDGIMVPSTTWYTEADSRQLCHEGQHDAFEELESIAPAASNDLPMTMLMTRNQMRKKDEKDWDLID
jgi:hypothetical protein